MTTEVLSLSLGANATATLGQGKTFYVKSATAPISITAEQGGSGGRVRKFTNIPAGFKFTAADDDSGFTYLRITNGATAQTVEIIVGDDDVSLSNAVSVTGAVSTISAPITTLSTPADVSVPNASASSIAANLARRAIVLGGLSSNTGSLRVQATGAGANRGLELQPGLFVTLNTTAAIDIRNDSGAAQSYWTLEES